MSTAKKFAGQTVVYGLSTIASRVLNFFLTPFYTHAYTPGVYGVLSTMFGWVSIINPILAFGMETTYFRYLNKYPNDKEKVYSNSFGAIFILTVALMLITLPFTGTLARFIKVGNDTSYQDFKTYVFYFVFILVIDAWCVIPFAKLRAEGQPGKFGIVKLVNIISFIALNLIFIIGIPYYMKHHWAGTDWLSQWYVKGWVGYVFLSTLIASILTLFMLLPELLMIQFKFSKRMFMEMFGYSWPIVIANLSFIVNETSDRLFLGKLLPQSTSLREVGIYSACAKIAVFLNIFIQAFRLGAEPFFFSHAGNKNSGQTYSRIMTYFVIAISGIFLAVVANIEILKYFVRASRPELQQEYWSGLRVVPLLLFGYVSLGIYMNLSIWYKLSDQTKYGLYISGIGALLTIVLNVLFIPKYSYMASAWTSLIAYASMMILSYVWGQKNYPIPYNLKKCGAYIVISVVLVFLSFTVFHRNIYAGNLLLVLFAAGTFINERKELMAVLKR